MTKADLEGTRRVAGDEAPDEEVDPDVNQLVARKLTEAASTSIGGKHMT